MDKHMFFRKRRLPSNDCPEVRDRKILKRDFALPGSQVQVKTRNRTSKSSLLGRVQYTLVLQKKGYSLDANFIRICLSCCKTWKSKWDKVGRAYNTKSKHMYTQERLPYRMTDRFMDIKDTRANKRDKPKLDKRQSVTSNVEVSTWFYLSYMSLKVTETKSWSFIPSWVRITHLNNPSLKNECKEAINEWRMIETDGRKQIHVNVCQEPNQQNDENECRCKQSNVAAVDPYSVISHCTLQKHGAHLNSFLLVHDLIQDYLRGNWDFRRWWCKTWPKTRLKCLSCPTQVCCFLYSADYRLSFPEVFCEITPRIASFDEASNPSNFGVFSLIVIAWLWGSTFAYPVIVVVVVVVSE